MQKELTTLFTGRARQDLDSVNSTNSQLVDLVKKGGIPEGFLLSADYQEAGRGQVHAKWKSEKGKNLLLSFAFFPSFLALNDIFMLNKAFALGVSDLVRKQTREKITIKWPNDIYFNDRKICGILVENSINSTGIQYTILGLGLNVNQVDFPKELPNPSSLRLITGKEFDREEVLADLCSCIEARYLQLKRNELAALKSDFEKILYRRDEWHYFISEREVFQGMIKGVDLRGRLLVLLKDDKMNIEKYYDLKEIKFLDK